jgi:hypothetical protein
LAAKQNTSENQSLKKPRRRGFFVAGAAAPTHALLIGVINGLCSWALLIFILLTAAAFFSFPHEEIDTH